HCSEEIEAYREKERLIKNEHNKQIMRGAYLTLKNLNQNKTKFCDSLDEKMVSVPKKLEQIPFNKL
ncbi:MAG: hypothetical protein MHPSP_001067, partial [Paramarteilia canceri]